MSAQLQPRDQDEYVLVRRTRIAALSRALGNPTTVEALEGDTVEDCLLEMAAQRLNTQGQNVMPHGIAHLLPPFTLTGHQLRWALMMANPDGASDPEQLDAAVSLQSKLPGKNVDGEDMPAGLYCWLHEYPEEGSICVDGPWVFGPDDFNFHRHLARQRAFSEHTFGPGMRTQGVIDHIRKELLEIEAAPTDLSEWIDVAILALDGAWRTGATPQQIIEALLAKQAKNEARQWPDWRTVPAGQAIEHVRASDSANRCADCQTPNSCGGDDKCLEKYISSRFIDMQQEAMQGLSFVEVKACVQAGVRGGGYEAAVKMAEQLLQAKLRGYRAQKAAGGATA